VTQAQLFAAELMQAPVGTQTWCCPQAAKAMWPWQATLPQAQTAGDAGMGAGVSGANRNAGGEQELGAAGLLGPAGAAWARPAAPAPASSRTAAARASGAIDMGHLLG
jgi:hypothetical protein